MTNIYRPEKGKTVTLLLDCGRMMGVELDQRTKLDLTLEAALVLAAVALREGDQVSLLAFSSDIKTYIPPGQGMSHLQTILEAVYDLKSDFVESNYLLALQYLMRFQKKRSFVVLFSDMENYLAGNQILDTILLLKKRHLTLLLSIEDPLLKKWTYTNPQTQKDYFALSLAQKSAMDQKQYIQQMGHLGVPILHVQNGSLAYAAVNHYMVMKAKEAL